MNEDTTRTAERPSRAAELVDVEPAGLAPRADDARRGAPVRTIEAQKQAGRAMDVERVIVRMSGDDLGQLFGALATAQGAFLDLERTRSAKIESNRAKYEYDYETLADVIAATKDALAANGLAVLQFPFPSSIGNSTSMTIRTILGHSSGQWILNDMTAAIDGADPRAEGSGITYLCRYTRKAILGIAADYDYDAEATARAKSEPAGGPRPGQRRSAQPSNVGTIDEAGWNENGTYVLRLSTGYRAGTKAIDVAAAAESCKAAKKTVEIVASEPTKSGYLPSVTEILVRSDIDA